VSGSEKVRVSWHESNEIDAKSRDRVEPFVVDKGGRGAMTVASLNKR
jgi:hypothetical protein